MKKVSKYKVSLDKGFFIALNFALIIYGSLIIFDIVRHVFVGNMKSINTVETRKFISSTIKSNNNIVKGKIFTQNGALQFDYTVDNEPTKEELTDIFNSSYEFFLKYDKLKNIVLKGYKMVCINIHFKNDCYVYEGRNFVYDKMDKQQGIAKTYNRWTLTENNVKIDTFTKDYILCED